MRMDGYDLLIKTITETPGLVAYELSNDLNPTEANVIQRGNATIVLVGQCLWDYLSVDGTMVRGKWQAFADGRGYKASEGGGEG